MSIQQANSNQDGWLVFVQEESYNKPIHVPIEDAQSAPHAAEFVRRDGITSTLWVVPAYGETAFFGPQHDDVRPDRRPGQPNSPTFRGLAVSGPAPPERVADAPSPGRRILGDTRPD